ncbi:MAG: 7-carboxy-7-deazaguanine synthase QueE [bacterium]|nr:7-carboxy-7-deazaguanine synthase QueE [bacterium]
MERPATAPGIRTAPGAAAAPTVMVSELYLSIQGESTHAGRPCVFVRLTGCPLRCTWCDSAHAFQGGKRLAVDEVLRRVAQLRCRLVEVTGGEPLAQAGCLGLLRALCDAGHEVLLETSGALDIAPVDPRVARIVDVKCPGSGQEAANRWENLACLRPGDELKFVLAGRGDYDWARAVLASHDLIGRVPILFSPAHGRLDGAELAAWIATDRLDVRLQLQLHRILWPDRTQGV